MNELKLKELDHQLEIERMNRDHAFKMKELEFKYHAQASTEKIENAKLGDTPERKDAFTKVTGALLDAINRKRGGGLPGGGTPMQ